MLDNCNFFFFSFLYITQFIVIVIISIGNVSGLANTGSSSSSSLFKASESNVDNKPKAEALTLVIHDLPTSPQQMNIPPQVKVIKERSDDVVHVFHSRPKRQRQSSRKRRPSSNSNFRSRIKSPPSFQSSSFGGFKDFTSSDFRNPPSSPVRGFAEPPRAKNKYKFGPTTTQVEGYNYTPAQKSKKSQKRERPSGGIHQLQNNKNFGHPPPSQNQVDTQFAASPSSASQNFFVDHTSIQTLQQGFNNGFGNFPSQNDAPQHNFNNDDSFIKPLNNFPLEKGPSYNFPKTSYGYPVRSINTPQGITKTNQFSVLGTNLDGSLNSQFPKLPNRYEQNEFSTPTRSNPSAIGNPFLNNANNDEQQPIFPQQSNRVNFKQFNKFKNFDYDFKNRYPGLIDDEDEDDEADESGDYVFRARRPRPVLNPTTTTTTTTTPSPFTPKQRPKKKNSFGKFKNRPQQRLPPQTHNLDTDDLRDAYGEASDVVSEYSSSAEDYKNFNPDFDSQRNTRRNHNPINLHELSSTLKSAKHQSPALRTALGDDFQIVSVQKSLEKDPRDVDFGFLKKHDYFDREFNVGGEINFGGNNFNHQQPAVWPENFPKNHRLA